MCLDDIKPMTFKNGRKQWNFTTIIFDIVINPSITIIFYGEFACGIKYYEQGNINKITEQDNILFL